MRKYTLIAVIMIALPFAGNGAVHSYTYQDHLKMPADIDYYPQECRRAAIEKFNDPNGWKWSWREWLKSLAPKYYNDKKHGSNHGWLIS